MTRQSSTAKRKPSDPPKTQAAGPVPRPLTPEQEARRAIVRRRNEAISAGVKAPASGTFGAKA